MALFLAGCALSDATVAATTRDDVSALDATRARHIAERWFVVVPGIVGAAAHAAGTVARTARGNERGDAPGRKSPRGSERSRPSSPDGSLDDADDGFFPETDESSRGPERDDHDHELDHDHDHDHDATPFSRLRFSDVAIASSARLAQGPLNLLASFAFLDGSWTAAAAAGDAASLASAAVSAASPTLSESYVVSESLEGVESLRSDLFATCPAADGAATSAAAAAARACEVAAESTAAFATSDAAHVAAGALFLASSFAWIVELRAERRLRRDAHATRTRRGRKRTDRGEEGDDG